MESLFWLLLLTSMMFVGSILVAGFLIVRMPEDYLVGGHPAQPYFLAHRPVLRATWLVVKNGMGFVTTAAGLVMLLTPGQGLLFIVIGLSLLDFPGKRSVLCRLIQRRGVLRMINTVRKRANEPPLVLPRSPRR